MKIIGNRKDFIVILLIVLVSTIALQTFFKPGLFETHDGRLHTIKLYWYVEALRSGQFPVRWTETANHQYGYPIFNFYYPLLFLLGSIPALLGISIVGSLKIVLVTTYLLSGVLFYFFLREWFGKTASLVGTILYQFAPYRFVSLFVTGRWAESISFAFIPLFFLSTSKLAKSGKSFWVGMSGISLSLFILSHNIQSLLFFPIMLLWLIALHFISTSHITIKRISLILSGGLLASSFFWAPALYELRWTYQGQHAVYNFKENFPSLYSYFYFPWGYGFSLTGMVNGVSPMIGFAQIIALGLGILGAFGVFGKEKKMHIISLLCIAGIAFFFMNKISIPLWETIPLLPSIQFPSRIITVLLFTSAIIGSTVIAVLSRSHPFISTFMSILLIALAFYGNRNHLRAGVFDRFNDTDITKAYYFIFGTGETSRENSPVWSQAFPPEFDRKIQLVYEKRVCPNADIRDIKIKSRNYRFDVLNNSYQDILVQANTIYYPGWKVFVNKKEAPVLNLFVNSKNRYGVIQFRVPSGQHTVNVLMTETLFRRATDWISLGAGVVLLGTLIPRKNY